MHTVLKPMYTVSYHYAEMQKQNPHNSAPDPWSVSSDF